MKTSVFQTFILLLLLALTSCKTTKMEYVPVESVKTEYKDVYHTLHDTTVVKDSVFLAVKGDTVYKEKYRYLYKYIYKTDTLTMTNTDSIPYTVEVPAKLTKSQQYRIDNYNCHVALLSLFVCSVLCLSYTRRK